LNELLALVLATGRYIGEGFDDPRLDTLFLALPVSWKGTLVQYTGRLHRIHPSKIEVRIYDYVDRQVPMLLRMFERRLRGYRAIGYARGEAPLGFGSGSARTRAHTRLSPDAKWTASWSPSRCFGSTGMPRRPTRGSLGAPTQGPPDR